MLLEDYHTVIANEITYFWTIFYLSNNPKIHVAKCSNCDTARSSTFQNKIKLMHLVWTDEREIWYGPVIVWNRHGFTAIVSQ